MPDDLALDQKPSVGRRKCQHPDNGKRYWNDETVETIYISSMLIFNFSVTKLTGI